MLNGVDAGYGVGAGYGAYAELWMGNVLGDESLNASG